MAPRLSRDEQIEAHIRALADLIPQGYSNANEMASAAMISVMDSARIKYVRDDDGKLWPFAPDPDGPWRGPLRKNMESKTIEEGRFDPETEKISWVLPWLSSESE